MNKVIILLITYLFISVIDIHAETIVVCDTCKTESIKKAIAISNPHDTIKIQQGTYKEYGIDVNKPLTLIGENHPLIDGEKQGEIMTITSDSVKIDGLILKNVGNSYTEDFAAIRVRKSNYFEIRNLVVENLFFGIYIEKSNHGKIINNKILGSAINESHFLNCIHLWHYREFYC